MDAAGSRVDAVAAAMPQLPACGPGIVEYHMLDSVSNIQDVDNAAVVTASPQEKKEHTNHESQIFVGTCNRTIALNVNLASDSVEEVKRLIEEREGIPVSEQHLTFGCKPLRHGTSLRDYEALGDESTINVIPRIRGGSRTGDHALRDLLTEPMTCDATVPGKQPQDAKTVQVLTEFGSRILHGVLTCILNAHRAGLAFGGACGMDNLRVHVYEGATGPLVVSRVYVRDDGGTSSSSPPPPPSLVPVNDESQKADYKTLLQVIADELFRDDKSRKAVHVGSIYKLLKDLAADDNKEEDDTAGSVITKGLLVGRLVKRTHLLQAYAAMISSPVAVATMCFNLKRFNDQLDDDHKTKFADALRDAQHKTCLLCKEVENQPLFENVYTNPPFYKNNNSSGSGNVDRSSVPYNPYEGGKTGMGLLTFARNWFTHVPEERWKGRTEKFEGLPQLDYIFTYHFPDFIPQALLHLYNKFDDDHSNLLTRVLFL